ncbi:hypothetical protein J6590_044262 [Homalodisca vitripennis]|nr:hypothetical protein J6590_044262 [Homalodisca vitripennis]
MNQPCTAVIVIRSALVGQRLEITDLGSTRLRPVTNYNNLNITMTICTTASHTWLEELCKRSFMLSADGHPNESTMYSSYRQQIGIGWTTAGNNRSRIN